MQESLISQLYAAATGRMEWHQPLARVAADLGLWCVQVIGVEKATGTLEFDVHAGSVTPACALDYLRFYHRINPRLEPGMALGVHEWMHDHELFDDRFVATHPFFKDFLVPHGGRYLSGTKLVDDENAVMLLGLMRGVDSKPLGPNEMPYMETLKHHLSEAFRNYAHLRERHGRKELPQDLLNPFPHAMLLVDDALGIIQRNAAADRLLAVRHPITERRGRLVCTDADCAQRILAAIEDLRNSGEDPLRQRRLIRLPRRDLPPLMLFISPIRPEDAMRAFGPTVRFLLIVHDPVRQPDTAHDPLLLAECFGFTPAEARIAAALASGYDVKEIAQRHRTSVHTVRSQLRAVLEKTQTNRQADLVRLLLTLPGHLS